MNPNSAKNADVIATLAAENRRFLKIVTGNIGCSARSSHITSVASSAASMPSPASVVVDAHPHSGASMIVNTSAVIAAIDSAAPNLSSGGALRSRDSGTTLQAAIATSAAIG